MSELILRLTSHFFMLVPFLGFVTIYFALDHDLHSELWTTVLKCAPIVCLDLYILLKGVQLNKSYLYSQRIFLGLLISCIGDALLNIDLFALGMATFASAQACYITAFGWKPLKLTIGIILYLLGAVAVGLFFRHLDGVLVVGLPIYTMLLLTMCWRALSRGAHRKDFLSVFCAIGCGLFVISDAMIAIDRFIVKIPYARLLIMSTYYLAQFAIALSTTDDGKEQILASTPDFINA